MPKPSEIFARDREWRALEAFATDSQPGLRLGVISGRRRQGKTHLLRALATTTTGFYVVGQKATETESLAQLGQDCVLACYSAEGFSDDLRQTAADSADVRLFGLGDLYRT